MTLDAAKKLFGQKMIEQPGIAAVAKNSFQAQWPPFGSIETKDVLVPPPVPVVV